MSTAARPVGDEPVPTTMSAAVVRGKLDVIVEERPVPEPGPGEVLVEVGHCGICGTDLHFLLEWGPTRPGSIGGHEWSGTVTAIGDGVDPTRLGATVIGGPAPRCGTCEFCLADRPSLCIGRGRVGVDDHQGAFADYVLARVESLVDVPDGLDARIAAITEPLAVSLHGITRAGGARAGTRWLVTGGGPIGYLSVAVLVAEGIDDVVVSEPHAGRRELCERLGATVVTPDELEPTPAMPMDVVSKPFDAVLECSGRADAMEQALGQLKRGGTLVLVGSGLKPPRFDPNRILLNELVVTGANTYDADGFPRAIELLASGRLPLDLLVEPDDYPLDQLLPAAEALGRGELARKVLVAPRPARSAKPGGVS